MKDKVMTGKVYNDVEYKQSGESVSTEYEERHIESVVVPSDHATVEAKLGMTISLGNYEFLRVDAGVTLPCDKGGLKEAYDEAFSITSNELFSRIKQAKESVPK